MDWETYKALCDRPDHFSRWMLEQTAELLAVAGEDDFARALSQRLRETLLTPCVDKPLDHRAPPASDMYALTLSAPEIECICQVVDAAVKHGANTSGTAHRGLKGFSAAWREFERFGKTR